MACCNWGLAMPWPWQHAKYWAGNYAGHPDYEVLGSPVKGSIGCRTVGKYGHVAWVTGVSGGTVYIHEQSCCWGCHHGFKDSSAYASYFNGGYIAKKGAVWDCTPGQQQSQACGKCGSKVKTCQSNGKWGGWGGCQGQGPCSPGQQDTKDCGDCGTHMRSCGGNCQWGSFGACAGADPDGGNIVCDSGELGVCAEGRERCLEGWVNCVALYEPGDELCDGLDNDCEGAVDNGFPLQMGDVLPAFAAQVTDVSQPFTLYVGEVASAWVEFTNVGADSWPEGGAWLRARSQPEESSQLAPPGVWPAWDTAAVLPSHVAPAAAGRFEFEVLAPDVPGQTVSEQFYLVGPDGLPVRCPQPEIEITVHVQPAPAVFADLQVAQPEVGSTETGAEFEPAGTVRSGGCGAAHSYPCHTLGWLVFLVLLALAGLHRFNSAFQFRAGDYGR